MFSWTSWRLAPLNWFKPSSKIFLLAVPRRYFFCGSFVLFLSCVCYAFAHLFIDALWSLAGKGLTSWLSFVMSRVFVTFQCGIYPWSIVVLDCIDF